MGAFTSKVGGGVKAEPVRAGALLAALLALVIPFVADADLSTREGVIALLVVVTGEIARRFAEPTSTTST